MLWQKFFSVELGGYFRGVEWATEGWETLSRKEKISLKKEVISELWGTENMVSYVYLRNRNSCLNKGISESHSDQTTMWGLGQGTEEMSLSPQRQQHEFLRIYLNSFTHSLA